MTAYLEKSALFAPQINDVPALDLHTIVVIPCYNEPHLIKSLEVLKSCYLPKFGAEVIVVFNDSESDTAAIKRNNAKSFLEAKQWSEAHSSERLKFHILYHSNLPEKNAGVGLARKIGMDEAVYRFEKVLQPKGIIVSFDADSLCQPNYLQAIETHFRENPESQACSIYFEHPTEGDEYPPEIYEAIVLYELHLRYYNSAKRFTGFPFAFESIGSSMAVRCDAYQQQGGMNKKKAGEDFYFLNKFMPLGHFTEIKTTTVIPSPRQSDRVPFGTGKAITEILESKSEFLTYAPQTFIDLKQFFDFVPYLFSMDKSKVEMKLAELPLSIKSFLESQDFLTRLDEIQANTTNLKTFYNRFFRWFNGFLMMKYVHHSRDDFHSNVPVATAATWLLKNYFKIEIAESTPPKTLLFHLRKADKK